MVESAITLLARKWNEGVLPSFMRESLLAYFPFQNIGGLDVREWAMKVIVEQSKAHMQKHGGKWGAKPESMNINDIRLEIYDVQYRLEMTYADMAFFEKHGILQAGTQESMRNFINKGNFNLFQGPEAGDQFEASSAQYNYFHDQGSGSGTISRPLPISAASAAVKWDAAGGAQKDAAKIAGNMRKLHKDPRMSVLFYPEVASEVFARPIVNGSSIFSESPVTQAFKNQGFIDCVPVLDALITRSDDAAACTVEEFDIQAAHIPDILIGEIKSPSVEIVPDPVDKVYYVDFQQIFCPLKIPIKYDGDSKIYSGIGQVTAIDANT